MLPLFNADSSLYQSGLAYYGVAAAAEYGYQPVRPAANTCTCTSPACTWSCPVVGPCDHLTGCARARCQCRLDDSCRVVPDNHPPCFFHCLCV